MLSTNRPLSDNFIELWLPFPPSANALWVRSRRGIIKSARYKNWIAEAAFGTIGTYLSGKMIRGPYKLTIVAARPDKRKRDLDNIIKPISDLLQYIGAIENDHLCEMISARWVTNGDGVGVTIEPAGAE